MYMATLTACRLLSGKKYVVYCSKFLFVKLMFCPCMNLTSYISHIGAYVRGLCSSQTGRTLAFEHVLIQINRRCGTWYLKQPFIT